MREYEVQELSAPSTYAQDVELAALARRIAVSRWDASLGVSLADWKHEHVRGAHPDAVKCAVDALIAHERRAQALAGLAHPALRGFTPPEGWTVRVEVEWVYLSGPPATPSLQAALRRIGGEAMASNSCWRVPLVRASSLSLIFARAEARAARVGQGQHTKLHRMERWLEHLEAKAAQGWIYSKAVSTLVRLGIADHPEHQARMNAALMKAAAVAAQPQAECVEDGIARAPSSRLPRRLLPLAGKPQLGTPVRFARELVVFTSATKPFVIRPEHPSIYGAYLRGHEGKQGAYFYYRSPTQDESARFIAPLHLSLSESLL